MNIYAIAMAAGFRYIRAHNAQTARVRAFKVYGVRAYDVEDIGQIAPDIGRFGYQSAVNSRDTMPLKAAQIGGNSDRAKGWYKPTTKGSVSKEDLGATVARLMAML